MKQQTSQKPVSMAWLCVGLLIMFWGTEILPDTKRAVSSFISFLVHGNIYMVYYFLLSSVFPWLVGALLICRKSFHFSYKKSVILSFCLLCLLFGTWWLPYFFSYRSIFLIIPSTSSIFPFL